MERLAQLATIFMGAVAVVFAMVTTRDLTAPMVLALAFGVVLSPVSDFWERFGFSPAFGALTSLLFAMVILIGLMLTFQPIVMQLIEAAPKVFRDVQEIVASFRSFTQGLPEFSQNVADALSQGSATPGAEANDAASEMPIPSMTDALMLAPKVAAQVLTFAGTLFFFLLSRASIYDVMARRLSEPSNRAVTATRLRDAEHSVSRYFLTVTAINAVFGLATAVALHVIGLPGATLWGTVAFILNFVVYLGPAILTVALLFAGIGAFDGAMVLAPAAAFVGLNMIEGQFVTPALVGRNMELNPLLVFVVLLFGIWVWGPIGGIVAIPLLLWARVLGTGLGPAAAARAVAAR
ncbi:MAG: AI-2E family transporter [Paracoccaceae bacterium]|nr:MAG: AI-2E family transporter [Paracoccaceae bacterium]